MNEPPKPNLPVRVLRGLLRALRTVPGFRGAEKWIRGRLLLRNLRRLHDVLERTPFAGRYWLFGGILLGWAREGRPLRHDYLDVDLAYDAEDDDRFAAAVPELVRAGFQPLLRFRSNDGEITEHTFKRRGAKIEFFRMRRTGDNYRYHTYAGYPHSVPDIEMISEIPAQPREPVEFIGRTWMKPADHAKELEIVYGNWRVPDTNWSFLDDGSIVERREWKHNTDSTWDG